MADFCIYTSLFTSSKMDLIKSNVMTIIVKTRIYSHYGISGHSSCRGRILKYTSVICTRWANLLCLVWFSCKLVQFL